MSQDSLTEKLAKANGNVKRLCEFFAARRDWVYAPEAETSTRELSSATAGVGGQIRRLMDACGAIPDPPSEPTIESIGAGTHDDVRLQRFATFLRDLDVWFAAQKEAPTDPAAIEALREIDAHIGCMVAIFEDATIARDDPTSEPLATGDAESASQTADSGESTRHTIPTDKDGVPQQLVLDDTDERPLVQDFQGISELTPDCEKLADEFLTAWDIELSYYNRKKFLERLLRWISSAPDGQVLVIKMKTAEEPYEPYPSYISRDVLDGKEPPQVH
jgi:hypothetical protein